MCNSRESVTKKGILAGGGRATQHITSDNAVTVIATAITNKKYNDNISSNSSSNKNSPTTNRKRRKFLICSKSAHCRRSRPIAVSWRSSKSSVLTAPTPIAAIITDWCCFFPTIFNGWNSAYVKYSFFFVAILINKCSNVQVLTNYDF